MPVSNDRGDVSIIVDPALRTVCVNGLATGTTVSLYSLAGELLYTEEAPSESIRIDLSSYAAGAYILSTGNTVHKLQLYPPLFYENANTTHYHLILDSGLSMQALCSRCSKPALCRG